MKVKFQKMESKAPVNNCSKFCPISSVIWTPTHKLTKFSVPISSFLTVNVLNSAQFMIRFYVQVKFLNFYPFMGTQYAKSLFLNALLDEVIAIVLMSCFLTWI